MKHRNKLPVGEGTVPDKALEELLAAFAGDASADAPQIDLDDPSIDVLLGLTEGPGLDTPDTQGNIAERALITEPVDALGKTDVQPVVPVSPPSPSPSLSPPAPSPLPPPADSPEVRSPIKIGGDDLPDALYLDEEAGDRLRGTSDRSTEASLRTAGDAERTTILIADDGLEGAAGGIPIGTGSASMDPRLRARRIAVRRAVGRRRMKWFVLGGAIIAVLVGALAVLGSSLFAVRQSQLQISGVHYVAAEDLDAAVNSLVGHPVMLIDTHSIEAQLERSPWVRQARVSTSFPHGASIEILERIPIATYQGPDGKFRIIDVEGMVVDMIQNQPVAFMLVTGPSINASPGTSAGESFTHAAELSAALSPAVRSRTAAVTVSATGELGLSFHNGATVRFGAPTELLDKLTRLEAILKRTEGDQCTTTIDITTSEPAVCSPH